MDALAQFGLGSEDLASQIDSVTYPKQVQGRVAHIDADFLAYQVSAETKDELDGTKPRKSLGDMQHNAKNAAEHLMRCAGATAYRCHITPSASTKGGRSDQAVQQEYQSSRKGRDKPEFLDATRAFIGQELNGAVHLDQEADDGLAQANYAACAEPGSDARNLSVIVSKDKDLRMAPGLHYDFDTETVIDVDDAFGSVWLDDSKSSKTLKGWGTKFFWAQCLMGDAADSIKGIPGVPGRVALGFKPTQAYTTAFDKWKDNTDPAKEAALSGKLDVMFSKHKLCGPAMTYDLIADMQSDKEAFNSIRAWWQRLEKDCGYEFTHWRTGERVTATQALLGDMLLLWMRRNKNPNDVIDWIKGVMK